MVGKRSTLNLPWNSSESVLFNYIPIGKQTKPVSPTQWFEVNTSRQTSSEFCCPLGGLASSSFQPAGRGTQLTRTEGLCPERLNVSVLRLRCRAWGVGTNRYIVEIGLFSLIFLRKQKLCFSHLNLFHLFFSWPPDFWSLIASFCFSKTQGKMSGLLTHEVTLSELSWD